MRHLKAAVTLATLMAAVAACGSDDEGGSTESASGSGGDAGFGAAAGLGGTGGMGVTGGAGGTSGAGGSGGTGGDGTGGDPGGSGTGAVGNVAGTAGAGASPPTAVAITTHDLDVQGVGTVFNVEDNYFNDGLYPATPVANFGLHSQIITVANDDGSLDVAWLDYATGGGEPWALPSPGMIYITHVDATLASATTVATGLDSYKLLGFTKDTSGAAYVAYNRDHALKTNTPDDQNNINGNELHVAKLEAGGTTWDQLIFGDQDNNADASLGDPGGAANSVLGYDPTHDTLVLYLGHSMMWDPVRHQAGFFRLLNPDTGEVLPPAGGDVIHFGSGWWYSHNFNQRLLIDDGYYYVLGHGDAYPRQLGFARWSLDGYSNDNGTDFDQPYWTIGGGEGDNNTNAQTGQFVRMPDGRFLMVHTTSEGRSARDVRLVFADGDRGTADGDAAVWLTSNPGATHATMPKVELLGDHVVVTYALWPEDSGHQLTWHVALLDASLATVVEPSVVPGVEFVDSAPLFRFRAGNNAGNVGWVSGNASHTLTVGVASLGYE